MEEIKAHSLDLVVRKVVPIDIMAIFEMNSSEETIDRSADLRQEVLSFIEIAYDSQRFNKMYINYPKHNLIKLRRLLKPFNDEHASLVQRSAGITDISRCEPRYSAILKPLFTEEAIFYE